MTSNTIPENAQERAAALEAVIDELILKMMVNLSQRGYALDNVCDRRHRAYDDEEVGSDDL